MRKLALAAALSFAIAAPVAAQPILEEPYAPFKLVGVMPDTGQVLLWDDSAAEYRLARAGEDLGGWKVSGLDLKDARGPRVALQREDLIDELELVRLPRPGAVIVFKDRNDRPDRNERGDLPGATVVTTTPLAPEAQPADPPPPPAEAAPQPLPIPTVAAPVPVKPAVKRIEPTVITPPPAADAEAGPPAAILQESRSLSRAEFDREINDFDRLMSSVQVERAEGGGFVLTRLERKSWLASLGFREGDVVRTIAGEKVSTVEDAARVYARLRTASSFAAEVQRGGTWVHLEIEIRDGK